MLVSSVGGGIGAARKELEVKLVYFIYTCLIHIWIQELGNILNAIVKMHNGARAAPTLAVGALSRHRRALVTIVYIASGVGLFNEKDNFMSSNNNN
jgi:hypothetical protein